MLFARLDPDDPDAVLLSIKAIPGARQSAIVSPLDLPSGPRLKVRTSAPPEAGKANKAICKLIAAELGLRPNAVTLVSGHTNPEKVLRIEGTPLDAVLNLAPP